VVVMSMVLLLSYRVEAVFLYYNNVLSFCQSLEFTPSGDNPPKSGHASPRRTITHEH